jgi:hypothetical protein
METIFRQQGPGRGAGLRLVSPALAALALIFTVSGTARSQGCAVPFGYADIGASVRKTFTVPLQTQASDGGPAGFIYGTDSSDFRVVEPFPTLPGSCSLPQQVTVTVEFTASGPGFRSATLTVGGRSTCGKQFGLVSLCGTGPSITCPTDIVVSNDAGKCGAQVTYPAPTPVGAAGAITCNPPPDRSSRSAPPR